MVASKSFLSLAVLSLTLGVEALKIMPLGASITFGQGSSTGNGYRQDLLDILEPAGFSIDYVGSQSSGSMADRDNEGYPGYVIDQVHDKAKSSVPTYTPELVAINLGTNDAVQNKDINNAGVRMANLCNTIWGVNSNTVIVLSTLINNQNSDYDSRVQVINEQYRGLVWDWANNQGKRIILAEMYNGDGPTLDDHFDGTHPNDVGFQKMANIWARAIQDVKSKGWI